MALERGPIPLYYQIARILRSQIHAGEYRPNDLLPTEEQLTRTYGVSRTTVRLAFQVLLRDGLVRRIPGRGTFITPDRGTTPAEWTIGSIDDILSSGHRMRRRILGRRQLPAPEGLAKALGVSVGTPVTEFCGVHVVDRRPFFHNTIHLPAEFGRRIPTARVRTTPVVSLVEELCGVRIVEAKQWIDASLADSEIARHLDLRPGDPVLLVERAFIDETGRVVEIAVDRYRTDRVRYALRILRRSPRELHRFRPMTASSGAARALPGPSEGRARHGRTTCGE